MNLPSTRSRLLLSLIFTVAGALHFLRADAYVEIMPPYVPLHRELVYLSGAFEMLGGLGLLLKRTRRPAGIGLILLLVAVWPANIQMVLNARASDQPLWWEALLWMRLPLQLLLMVWVWRASQPRAE